MKTKFTFFLDYLGCFKDYSQHPSFRYIPSDFDPVRVTPLTCFHACSIRYQYAAVAGKRVCLCSNVINNALKVDDENCVEDCTVSHGSHVCNDVVYYAVYWKEKSIMGLVLNIDKEVDLFSTSSFNASVLGQDEVEFRYFCISDQRHCFTVNIGQVY